MQIEALEFRIYNLNSTKLCEFPPSTHTIDVSPAYPRFCARDVNAWLNLGHVANTRHSPAHDTRRTIKFTKDISNKNLAILNAALAFSNKRQNRTVKKWRLIQYKMAIH